MKNQEDSKSADQNQYSYANWSISFKKQDISNKESGQDVENRPKRQQQLPEQIFHRIETQIITLKELENKKHKPSDDFYQNLKRQAILKLEYAEKEYSGDIKSIQKTVSGLNKIIEGCQRQKHMRKKYRYSKGRTNTGRYVQMRPKYLLYHSQNKDKAKINQLSSTRKRYETQRTFDESKSITLNNHIRNRNASKSKQGDKLFFTETKENISQVFNSQIIHQNPKKYKLATRKSEASQISLSIYPPHTKIKKFNKNLCIWNRQAISIVKSCSNQQEQIKKIQENVKIFGYYCSKIDNNLSKIWHKSQNKDRLYI